MKKCKCGCDESAPEGKDFIRGHWSRTAAAKKMFSARRRDDVVGNVSGICLCGCGEKVPISKDNRPERGYYKGQNIFYVPGHYLRGRKRERAHSWKGGKYRHAAGYILVLSADHPNADGSGYVLEHRLVMEKKIGRFLTAQEKVHHINGIKDDNQIENLVVTRQSPHVLHHNPLGEWRKDNPQKSRKHARKAGKKGAEARWSKVD